MANPNDTQPVLDAAPADEALQRDTRSPSQRNHDGLNAAFRAVLASGKLGQHNGLPATIIITTLGDLEAAAGKAPQARGSAVGVVDLRPEPFFAGTFGHIGSYPVLYAQ
jgi:hypothetical protein